MLSKIILENFKSFKDETVIDLVKTGYQSLSETNTRGEVLKGLMFIGGNGTGKTNAILSIKVLLDLLFLDINIMPYFCMFSDAKVMKLEYEFKQGEDIINYHIEIMRDGVIAKEILRVGDEIILDRINRACETGLTEKRFYDESDIDARTLFLRNIYMNTKFTENECVREWYGYLQNSVYFNSAERTYTVYNVMAPNLSARQYLEEFGEDEMNDFFNAFGFNQKIEIGNKHKMSEYSMFEMVDERYKEIFIKRNDMEIWMPYVLESLGNKTLLELLPKLFYVIKRGGMLLIDEFSSAFHNELEELVVRYFFKNADNAQLFFVTHSTNLITSTLMRPDQIYTVSFCDENGSKLYRISNEHPRESQNFEKMYLNNIFKGLPHYKTHEDK